MLDQFIVAYDLAGDFKVNYGRPKRTGLVGPSGPQGYSEEYIKPYIEGMIRDSRAIKLTGIADITDATIQLVFANDKTGIWSQAYYCGDADLDTATGEFSVKFESESAEELLPPA